MNPVTLQVNVTSDDLRHCRHLLFHQLDIFSSQVGEILITDDTKPGKIMNEAEFEENKANFKQFLDSIRKKYEGVRIHHVDYTPEVVEEVTSRYFGRSIPTHDYRGAPVYAYLYGIDQAKYDFVFHMDSDMFFGGMSQTWMREAIALLESSKNILTVSPLPGPPHPQKKLVGQDYFDYDKDQYSFGFYGMSTRIFMLNRTRLYGNLQLRKPGFKDWAFSKYAKFPAVETLERTISSYMRKNDMIRVDFKGDDPGLWSIHPSYRSELFYQEIPAMVKRVVENDVPESQLGYYDFSLDFIDWSEALQNHRNKRLRNNLVKKVLRRS